MKFIIKNQKFHRILHDDGFSEEEMQKQKHVVFSNMIVSMIMILNAMAVFGIEFEDAELEAC